MKFGKHTHKGAVGRLLSWSERCLIAAIPQERAVGCALLTLLLSPARGPVVSTGVWKEGKDKRGMSADGNVRSCTNGAAPALGAWCLPPSSGWWVRAAQRLPRALQDEVSGDAHLHLNSRQVEHVSTFQNLFCFSLRIRVPCFEGRNVFEKDAGGQRDSHQAVAHRAACQGPACPWQPPSLPGPLTCQGM